MADLTITITVTSRAGGVTTTWARTGAVADIQDTIFRATDSMASPAFTSEGGAGASGVYSETGIAALVCIAKGVAGVAAFNAVDSSSASIGCPMMPCGIPLMIYGGAGTGFVGAMKTSGTATDVPDVDLDGLTAYFWSGRGSFVMMAGIKPVS